MLLVPFSSCSMVRALDAGAHAVTRQLPVVSWCSVLDVSM